MTPRGHCHSRWQQKRLRCAPHRCQTLVIAHTRALTLLGELHQAAQAHGLPVEQRAARQVPAQQGARWQGWHGTACGCGLGACTAWLDRWIARGLAYAASPGLPDRGVSDAACEAGMQLHLQCRGRRRRQRRREGGGTWMPAASTCWVLPPPAGRPAGCNADILLCSTALCNLRGGRVSESTAGSKKESPTIPTLGRLLQNSSCCGLYREKSLLRRGRCICARNPLQATRPQPQNPPTLEGQWLSPWAVFRRDGEGRGWWQWSYGTHRTHAGNRRIPPLASLALAAAAVHLAAHPTPARRWLGSRAPEYLRGDPYGWLPLLKCT